MQAPPPLQPQERLLYWLLGPRLRAIVARLDALLRTRPALGRTIVVATAIVAITLVMVGFTLDDAYGPTAAILYFAGMVAVFRLAPFPLPKAPPRLDGL